MAAQDALALVESEGADTHMALAVTNLGYTTQSALGSLAFVVFDPTKNNKSVETYHASLNWTGQEGREINPLRLKQLLGQSTVARKALCSDDSTGLQSVVGKLVKAISQHKVKVIWVYPTDLGMFTNLCMQNGIKPPWSTVSLRDPSTALKTGIDLGIATDVKRGEFEPEDHALGDASYVSRMVRAVYAGPGHTHPTKEIIT